MNNKVELTYGEQQRLNTCCNDDYLWQYASNPEIQLQMLQWEHDGNGDDLLTSQPKQDDGQLFGRIALTLSQQTGRQHEARGALSS